MEDKIRFCPHCGSKLKKVREGTSFFFRCNESKHIVYPNPTPAIAAIIIRGDKILLSKRSTWPYIGHWSLPSGFIDYGEEGESALKRELKEELGIVPKKYNLFLTKLGRDYPGKLIFQLYYVVHTYKGTPSLVSKENSQISWFKLNKIPKMAFKNNNYAVRQFISQKKK